MSLQTIKSANEPLKILALHGRGSNGDVTRMQLENLGLLDSEYEIIHINGPISTQEPGSGLSEMERIVSGPWFSWLPRYENEEKVDSALLLRAICEAVKLVLDTVTEHGPFDGVFGFSQGGVVASLVNGLPHDNALKEALIDIYGAEINENYLKQKAFTTTIVACAAAPLSIHSLRMVAGLGDMPTPEFSSLHLIGKNDQFKPWSESLALSFGANNAEVYYLNDGHEISRNLRHDAQLGNILRASFSHDSSHQVASIENVSKANWQQSSPISARKVDLKTQIAEVQISNSEDSETISDLLAAQPAGAPLFRVAREKNENVLTTYGQLLAFFQPEGEGDLRRIGVEPGDVVAYLAPSGGNATAAAAFLSIASQTCAVPFSPNMSAADALMALEQFNVKHVIVFENVVAKGVMQAIEAYAAEHTLNVRNATAYSAHTPGLFKFEETIEDFEQLPALKTAPTDNGLLLRTSGTTSVPKVVPLRLKDLVTNGVILADGMGLNANDVTYSVMPLDHIGGLSASILCSIAVGASITCDGLYNPQDMVDALKSSNPQPTWYSAVPTIHNATVRFLQDNADAYLSDNGEWFGHNLRMIRSGAAALKESDRESLAQTFGCEVVTTYSMSELMPICQPPRKEIGWQQQAGAVGVPVSASMAIVDPVSLKPMPFGGEGEIAISGETVFTGYLDNAEANNKSRFIMKSPSDGQLKTWFLTGDLGEMDKDGTVFLRGRIKELIKRGGEQIAPAEVENVLTLHPSIKAAVCFSVASETYGEEVGCALVLEPSSSQTITANNALKELRALLRENGLAPHKYPSVWRIVEKEQLPMTASKKYKRNGLAKVLGITSAESEKQQVK